MKLLHISQIKYRVIRLTVCLALNTLYRNFIEDIERSNILQNNEKVSSKQTTLLKFFGNVKSSKIDKINQFINILKELYIIRRSSDVSPEIRFAVCDLLTKQTKSYFLENFKEKLSSYYKYFLSDSDDSIKINYLKLLFERIEKDVSVEKDLIEEILYECRKLIINLCLKKDNKLAKAAIKIIEILSQKNCLTFETVNYIVPHLLNPNKKIRNRVRMVVINSILNSDENNTQVKELKVFTFEIFIKVMELFCKLSDRNDEIISILVDDFYNKSEFLKRFDYFFQLLSELLQENNDHLVFNHAKDKLISVVIKTLKFTKLKLQIEIKYKQEEDEKIKKEEQKKQQVEEKSKEKIQSEIKSQQVDEKSKEKIQSEIKSQQVDEKSLEKIQSEIKSQQVDEKSHEKIQSEIKSQQVEDNLHTKLSQEFVDLFFDKIHIFLNKLLLIHDVNNFLELLKFFEILIFSNEKIEFNNFEELLQLLEKAFLLEDNEIIDLFSYAFLIETLLKMIQKLIIQYKSFKLSKLNTESLRILSQSLNESFISMYKNTVIELTNLNKLNYKKLYVILLKYLFLLKHNNLSDASFLIIDSISLIIKILTQCSYNFNNHKEIISTELMERFTVVCLDLGNEILFMEFNKIVNSSFNPNKIRDYIGARTNFLDFIQFFLQIPDNYDKQLYLSILKLKSKAVCILFEIYLYSCSDQIKETILLSELYYPIPDIMILILQNFLSNYFLKYLYDYSQYVLRKIIEDKDTGKNNKNSQISDDETDKIYKESRNKTYIYESIDENVEMSIEMREKYNIIISNFSMICISFSKLLLLNLGMFNYKSFCSLYFEAFFLLKMPKEIRDSTKIFLHNIRKKELEYYYGCEINSYETKPLCIIIHYVTRIAAKLFNNKLNTLCFREFDLNYKIQMIKNIWRAYLECIRKEEFRRDFKLYTENLDLISLHNFIYYSIFKSMEKSVITHKNGKTEIFLKNIGLLEFLESFLLDQKPFLGTEDFKRFLVYYIQICNEMDLIKTNPEHLYFSEKFGKFLVLKACFYRNNKKSDNSSNEDQIIEEDEVNEDPDRTISDFENDEIQLTCEKKTKQSTNKKKSISVKSKRSFDESGINSGSSRKLKHSDDI